MLSARDKLVNLNEEGFASEILQMLPNQDFVLACSEAMEIDPPIIVAQ
jgi:hypothetical protein